MITFSRPLKCTDCGSRNVGLGAIEYKKDVFGEETEEVIGGTWFCNDCGYVLGRKISKYENDINDESIWKSSNRQCSMVGIFLCKIKREVR